MGMGWVWVCGEMFHACRHTHTCTCMLNMLNMLNMDASMSVTICNFYTCVVVLTGYMLDGPTIFPNYIPWLPWQLHKLLLPNHSPCTGPCKWQPPRLPFASALVTDRYQYSGCSPHMRVAPLHKRAGLPGPLLTFWLNMIPVTSRSKTRNLTLTLAKLSVHMTYTH